MKIAVSEAGGRQQICSSGSDGSERESASSSDGSEGRFKLGCLNVRGLSNCNHHLDRFFWRCRLFRQGKGGDQDPGAHELGAGLCRPLARSKIPRAAMHREFVICKLDSRWAT